ncbi:DDHD domain containing protein [Nitzschia inconspicua]|uniref:DDHD domain containing protein n=1 Tax=Nitzschia inconspicua TaxID=303405 RepID=A0A9K3M7G3_9STRA|nr:DDHD domain containing protein [Nitzschia inconspicua]
MVNWHGIEDTGLLPTRVWLSRTKETGKEKEEWKPLRKVDCLALNNRENDNMPVLIEGGRSTADVDFGVIRANFVVRPLRALESAIWFVVEDHKKDPATGKQRPVLEPMPDAEAEKVEELYQRAIYAASSLGTGIDPLLKEQVKLEGTDYHIEVGKESGAYKMQKCPNGWLGKSFDLQRGYGAYTVEGEEEEETLGPVRHVVFVVHGIGEAMWSRDDFRLAPSLIEITDNLRLTIQKRQIEDWKKKCDAAEKRKQSKPPPPDRVEFLPITWYDQVHSSSNALMRTLKSVTLNTIPALRAIANDVILDVLLYLTPNYCYDVLENVTDQIIALYGVFNKIYPDFALNGGKSSIIGHSLGSVICWDLLSLKRDATHNDRVHGVHITTSHNADNSAAISYQQFAGSGPAVKMEMDESENIASNSTGDGGNGTWGPALPKPLEKYLPFDPDFTMFLGSPVGLFLTLRGAHAIFDELRQAHPDRPLAVPFNLPTRAMYNIYSPSDPVAYRIEPLLLAQDTKDLPEPQYLTRPGEDVRLHVKAMQLGNVISQSLSMKKQKSSLSVLMSTFSEHASSVLSHIDEANAKNDSQLVKNAAATAANDGTLRFPLAGRSGRLDYQLQPRVIDNEYISAVTAHSGYFLNSDVTDFIMDLGLRKEDIIDLTTDETVVTSMDYELGRTTAS